MAVLRLVVDRRAALHDFGQAGRVEGFARPRGAPHLLGERKRRAPVAVRHADQRRAGLGVERQRPAGLGFRASEQPFDRVRLERPEHQHPRARE